MALQGFLIINKIQLRRFFFYFAEAEVVKLFPVEKCSVIKSIQLIRDKDYFFILSVEFIKCSDSLD